MTIHTSRNDDRFERNALIIYYVRARTYSYGGQRLCLRACVLFAFPVSEFKNVLAWRRDIRRRIDRTGRRDCWVRWSVKGHLQLVGWTKQRRYFALLAKRSVRTRSQLSFTYRRHYTIRAFTSTGFARKTAV